MQKLPGFTLVELVVVMGIMATLMAVILPRLGSYNKSQTVQAAAASVQSAIRTAQSNALNKVKCDAYNSSSKWHFGFRQGTTSYEVFSEGENCYVPSFYTYNFPPGVTLSRIGLGDNDGSIRWSNMEGCGVFTLSDLRVTFETLTGKVELKGACSGYPLTPATSSMIIELGQDLEQAQVVVEKGGAIYVKP